MTAVIVCVSLLVVLALAVVFLSCAEKSREIDVVTRNRPLHPAERGPGAYLLPPPDVPFDVLPPSAAIVPPPHGGVVRLPDLRQGPRPAPCPVQRHQPEGGLMGYYTSVTGEIAIDPPLTNAEIKGSPFVPKDGERYSQRTLNLRVVETPVETDDGTLIRRTAPWVVPPTDEGYKAYDIVAHLQELVDAYGSDHAFTGYLEGAGEDSGDMWRLMVRDGKAVQVKARIVWDS